MSHKFTSLFRTSVYYRPTSQVWVAGGTPPRILELEFSPPQCFTWYSALCRGTIARIYGTSLTYPHCESMEFLELIFGILDVCF